MQVTLLRTVRRLARRWHSDRSGASLVQFIAVLPAFVVIVYGTFTVWSVMSARDRLCNAAWQAARYLQVEGPRFPEEARYPDDWAAVALDFLKEEAAGSELLASRPLDLSNVTIWPAAGGSGPGGAPRPPESAEDSTVEAVEQAQFAVRFTVEMPHPFPRFWAGKPDETEEEKDARSLMTLTCQRFAYVEMPPIGATARTRGRNCPGRCDDDLRCTAGPPPTPTPDPCPGCATPDPCFCPCRNR